MVRRKLNEKVKVSEYVSSHFDMANEYSQMYEEFMRRALEYKQKSLREHSKFWRSLYNENEFPKTFSLNYNPYTREIEVMPTKNEDVTVLQERDLNIRVLELEIAMLKKRIAKKN